MTGSFTTEQWVPFGVEPVFRFFVDPRNLPRLMPERLETAIEDLRVVVPQTDARSVGSEQDVADSRTEAGVVAGRGSEILLSFRPVPWVPIRLFWLARITEFSWNDHFCDEQVRGPFAFFRHCHRVSAEKRNGTLGTLVRDEIEFALSGGPVGRLANPMVLRELKRSFAARQARLPELIAKS